MEAAQKKRKRTYNGGARDVVSATGALRRIVRAGRLEAGLTGIDIHIEGNPEEPGVAYCYVDIHGDSQADAEKIAERYEDDGWTCQSTGPTDVRCESPD
jgi:hypothetical protein